MSLAEGLLLAVVGIALGRLLNLTIDRLPPQTTTPAIEIRCQGRHPFNLKYLLPVIGYFWWHRQCSICALRIPRRALLVELVTAAVCGVVGYWYGLTPAAAILIFYCALFIHLAFVDLEHSLLLNVVVVPAIPVALAVFPFSPLPLAEGWGLGEAYLRSLAGMGLGFGVMLLIFLASRGGMGLGDVKLVALLGAILGFPQIVAGLAIAFILGGAAGVIILVLKLRRRSEPIPFGPALVIGTALVAFGGTAVYGWYLNLFR